MVECPSGKNFNFIISDLRRYNEKENIFRGYSSLIINTDKQENNKMLREVIILWYTWFDKFKEKELPEFISLNITTLTGHPISSVI